MFSINSSTAMAEFVVGSLTTNFDRHSGKQQPQHPACRSAPSGGETLRASEVGGNREHQSIRFIINTHYPDF